MDLISRDIPVSEVCMHLLSLKESSRILAQWVSDAQREYSDQSLSSQVPQRPLEGYQFPEEGFRPKSPSYRQGES